MREFDFFQTPDAIVRETYTALRNLSVLPHFCESGVFNVLDIGAGAGAWARPLLTDGRPPALSLSLTGVEIRDVENPDRLYDVWIPRQDFLSWNPFLSEGGFQPYSLVVGNPPFKDNLPERIVSRVLDGGFLREDGHLVFLMRSAILWGKRRHSAFWLKALPLLKAFLPIVPRPSFTGNGKTDTKTEYAVFVFSAQKPSSNMSFLTKIQPLVWR